MATSGGKSKAVIHAGERTFTPEELIQLVLRDRDEAERVVGDGVKVEAPRAIIDAIRRTPVGEHVGEDGSVALAVTSLELVLVVAIIIAGFFGGWNLGYDHGHAAGQAQTQDEGEGEGEGEEGRGEGEGEGGEGEGGGGEGGGEGGGGEGGG